ncbi:GrpB family protein [Pseudoalteromonas byunsanensis]|uniref:GrpB family protein n=1 Tax=Pseudoalteromonas byunsanensis TaxID=327939 RepID=A0A1S1N658_9GAMM|nr:GrpB family protein [Pseudoalteromonas byunsanensis]OHU94937.1 hypothetical protein BIW53_13030 [Pseudoalteromonas byunsanensis]
MSNRIIEVVTYNTAWPNLFQLEKEKLSSMLGELAVKVEHIGSTSVPGLSAKPIIDILVEVTNVEQLDLKAYSFRRLGYEVKGENGIVGRRYYQKGGSKRSHHIHAFQSGSKDISRHLAFKEYLIAHPRVANMYALIKQEAASQCANDNELYMAKKNGFIARYEELAIKWYDFVI